MHAVLPCCSGQCAGGGLVWSRFLVSVLGVGLCGRDFWSVCWGWACVVECCDFFYWAMPDVYNGCVTGVECCQCVVVRIGVACGLLRRGVVWLYLSRVTVVGLVHTKTFVHVLVVLGCFCPLCRNLEAAAAALWQNCQCCCTVSCLFCVTLPTAHQP